jgi:hypothetical protein
MLLPERAAAAGPLEGDSDSSSVPGVTGTNSAGGSAIEAHSLVPGIGLLADVAGPGDGSVSMRAIKGVILDTQAQSDSVAVEGVNHGPYGGAGVFQCINPSSVSTVVLIVTQGSGPALDVDSALGIGVRAKGGLAPLLLTPPISGTGPPTSGSHTKGEVFLDSTAAMFVCTASGGAGGTWARVSYGAGAFNALNPTRVCDTRANTGPGGSLGNNPLNVYSGQKMAAFSDLTVRVAGPIGPTGAQQTLVPETATAVVLNVTVVNFTAPGNFTVYPADLAGPPNAANLNWPGAQSDGLSAIGNSVTVRIGNPAGDSSHRGVKIHNASAGTTDVVVDLAGYYE